MAVLFLVTVRRFSTCFLFLAAVATSACQNTSTSGNTPAGPVSPDTWAVVDGRQITRDDVEKAFRRMQGNSDQLSPEEAMTAKLSLLNDMIVQELLLARAQELKVELPESELDQAFNEAKQNIPDDAFQKELARRNLTAGDMREGLRRELLTQKVMEQEIGAKVSVTDQEVTDFFNANKAQFNFPEEAYRLAQIVVTPAPEPQLANRTGDDAGTPQAANAKVQMLMERLKNGASFQELAADYSEDPESAPRGGDIGFIPLSRIKQAPPVMRDAVLNKEPGSVNVVSTGGAHTIVLVVAHERAGQRDLATPGVRETITENLRGRKEQLLRAAYLTKVRSDARVENHLARRLVEDQGRVPSLAPTAPGNQ
jgi:peptidyl-prolyl cis-trans isomerase SurA